MVPKIRNIIIFIIIAAVFVLIYIFFTKSSSPQASLISSSANTTLPSVNDSGTNANIPSGTSSATQDFLTLLLNVQTIKLDDSIFLDPAFSSLHDSSIILSPDPNPGRPDPFAQFGAGDTLVPLTTSTTANVSGAASNGSVLLTP